MFFLYTGNVTTAGNNQLILSNTTPNGANRSLLDFSEFNEAELGCDKSWYGVRIMFLLVLGFLAAVKFYFRDQGHGVQIFMLCALLTLLLLFACLHAILFPQSQRNTHQEHHIQEEHIASVTATNSILNENIRPISVVRQNPPPPYHIAILIPPNSSDEAPPPSYDKVV